MSCLSLAAIPQRCRAFAEPFQAFQALEEMPCHHETPWQQQNVDHLLKLYMLCNVYSDLPFYTGYDSQNAEEHVPCPNEEGRISKTMRRVNAPALIGEA